MRILYVTQLWSGFKDIIIEGKEQATGMPAFIYPLRKLVESGHSVDFVVATSDSDPELNIGADWLRNSRVDLVHWVIKGTGQATSVVRMYSRLQRILGRKGYDFVYGQGAVGSLGCLVAQRYDIACGQRLYGTFLADEVSQKPAWYTLIVHPLEYLSFTARKNFLIVTNDGTRGDHVHRKLARGANYDFRFWFNGVDRPTDTLHQAVESDPPVLFFPARVSRWKQQHLALDILGRLHAMGHGNVRLHFAGHISEPDYWDEILQTVHERELAPFVSHLGRLNRQELLDEYRRSLAVLSLYRVSNLGNVSLEALACGAVLVTWDDGSVAGIVQDGISGFLAHTPVDAAERIGLLLQKPELAASIRQAAKETAAKHFSSWDSRAAREVEMIEKAVSSRGGWSK